MAALQGCTRSSTSNYFSPKCMLSVRLLRKRPAPSMRRRVAAFDVREDRISVRSRIWGPVSRRPLLGRPVAVRWTALDLDAFDLGLLDLDAAATVEQATGVLRAFGGPRRTRWWPTPAAGRVSRMTTTRLMPPYRRIPTQSRYSSLRQARGSAGWGFGARSSRKL